MTIEKVYYRLRELAEEINSATNDQGKRDCIQRSWRLQDLLSFQEFVSIPIAPYMNYLDN